MITWYVHVLNTEGLNAGSMYVLNRKYALNKRVRLTNKVYGIIESDTDV